MLICRLLIVFLHKILKKTLSGTRTIGLSNSLGPEKTRRSVGPDLDPNCLQRSSAYDKIAAGWQSFNTFLSSCISGYLGSYAKDHIQTFHRL